MHIKRRMRPTADRCWLALSVLAAGLSPFLSGAEAQSLKRTLLQTTDFPSGYVTSLYAIDVPAGAAIQPHVHPGVETLYILEGEIDLVVGGQPAKHLKAGDGLQIAPGTIHSAAPSGQAVRVISTYVVEKGKPLATLTQP